MSLFFNHPLICYGLGSILTWFGCMLTMAFWCDGKGAKADAFVWPMAIAGGLFWPVGIALCFAFWFWQMILMLDRFYGEAFSKTATFWNGCNHTRVDGARFCPRCGRPTKGGRVRMDHVHSDGEPW